MNPDFKELRKNFDSNESFVAGGFETKSIRHRIKKIPTWALENKSIKSLLVSVFPKLNTNLRQRQRAGRWMRAIHLYYRVGMPHNHVSQEMKISYGALVSLLRNIRRAGDGLRADNGELRTGKRGRPKK